MQQQQKNYIPLLSLATGD